MLTNDMIMNVSYPNSEANWQKLQQLAKQIPSISELFARDSNHDIKRGNRFSVTACDIYMDFSKQKIDQTVLAELIELAKASQLSQEIKRLLSGARVNDTENRPALHTALRQPSHQRLEVNGQDIIAQVHESLAKAEHIVNRIRDGVWRGFSGNAITDVVNIGVGGSDLGPLMATTALSEWSDTDIRVHFVSNMDGTQLDNLLKILDPKTTLFIISSKSFSTIDTLSNAKTALAWLQTHHDNVATLLRRHFLGISTRTDKMSEWGIHPDNQLLLWDWVGGRFSMWSVIGLAIAIKVGMSNFYELLAGANAMDEHFAHAEFEHNLPVLLGLLGVWNSTFLGINAHAILPYDGRLSFFPNYLTQLEMESNGKSVNRQGKAISYTTCPILWGDIGSNAQHAFYQLLHQGTQAVSCDFIAPMRRYDDTQQANPNLIEQHELSLSNCLAQSQVLAFGNAALPDISTDKSRITRASTHTDSTSNSNYLDSMAKFKHYRGNQPSTTLLLKQLSPRTLGALIALYEHKVFVMSVIWQINPFDQWGVEVGKVMANSVFDALQDSQHQAEFDSSTNALLSLIQTTR